MRRTKRLTDLLDAIGPAGVACAAGAGDVGVTGVCEDSRTIEPGVLFVAIDGTARDGTDFAAAAVARGAVAVVAERPLSLAVPVVIVPDARRALADLAAAFYDTPTEALRVVGVTGTNGKTTVCHWIAHLLGPARTELVGTVANEARGLPAMTTPASPIVQRIAREAVDAGREHLVIEASSIGLAQGRLDAVSFDVVAFTNLGEDHADLHPDRDAYLAAKAGLFRRLGPDGWGVVNADDPHHAAIAAACRGRTLTVGRARGVDLRATGVEPSSDRVRFVLESGGRSARVDLPAAGVGRVENALVAAGVGLCAGLDLTRIAARLRTAPDVPGRWSVFRDDAGTTAIVDFAHNPDALARALEALQGAYDRIVAVFGVPGGTDRAKRLRMGEIAGRAADVTVLTNDNPKDEAPESILAEIASGVRRVEGHFETCADRAEAIGRAVTAAGAGGVVLVAGKGHERYQIVRGEHIPYADGAVLARLGFRLIAAASESSRARRANRRENG